MEEVKQHHWMLVLFYFHLTVFFSCLAGSYGCYSATCPVCWGTTLAS